MFVDDQYRRRTWPASSHAYFNFDGHEFVRLQSWLQAARAPRRKPLTIGCRYALLWRPAMCDNAQSAARQENIVSYRSWLFANQVAARHPPQAPAPCKRRWTRQWDVPLAGRFLRRRNPAFERLRRV